MHKSYWHGRQGWGSDRFHGGGFIWPGLLMLGLLFLAIKFLGPLLLVALVAGMVFFWTKRGAPGGWRGHGYGRWSDWDSWGDWGSQPKRKNDDPDAEKPKRKNDDSIQIV